MARKKQKIFVIALLGALLFSLAVPTILWAATGGESTQIDLPKTVKIEHDSDVTAAMFQRLFGDSWSEITGAEAGTSAGIGTYSGLIVSILGVVNVAAMAFVASSIIYMWAIFAVTTAHEGKKLGGSMFNSLWIPVRHAFSFSLCVPVLNGLSLMQIAIITCVALSINFANVVWKASSSYLIEHAGVATMISASPAFEKEALKATPYMFSDAVAQRVVAEQGFTQNPDFWLNGTWEWFQAIYQSPEEKQDLWALGHGIDTSEKVQDRNLSYAFYDGYGRRIPDSAAPEHDLREGMIVVRDDALTGDRSIFLQTYEGVSEADTTRIHVPMAPVAKNGRGQSVKPSSQAAAFAQAIGEKRTEEVVKLWAKIWQMAECWLHTPKSANNAVILSPAKEFDAAKFDIQEAINDYNKSMVSFIEKKAKELEALMKENTGAGIGKIIGQEASGKTTDGWVSAGFFYFGLASHQKQADEALLQKVTFTAPSNYSREFLSGDRRETLNESQKMAIENAPHFASETLLKGSSYAATAYAQSRDDFGGILKDLGTRIASIIIMPGNSSDIKGKGADRAGLLGQTLDLLGAVDPICVISSFGERLITAAMAAAGASVVWKLVSGDMIGLGLVALLLMVGAIFAYVVPITPVIFWLRALLSWVFMVIEAMVAAPFWVCTHALPEGAGFAGQHARRGYMMLLNIVCRPTLMVLGAVFAIAMVQAMGWLFNVLLNRWFATVGSSFIEIGIVADVCYTIIVMSLMYYLSLTLFTKGVNYLPDHVMRWCGGEGTSSAEDAQDTRSIIVAGAAFNRVTEQLTGAQRGLMQGLGKRGKGENEKDPKQAQATIGTDLPSIGEGPSAGAGNKAESS